MKLTKIFLAVIALLTIACNNGNNGGGETKPSIKWGAEGTIVGEWALTSWAGHDEAHPEVYIAFNEDGTFALFQQQYSVVWLRYTGTYTLEGKTLKGAYTDGTPLACDYKVDYGTTDSVVDGAVDGAVDGVVNGEEKKEEEKFLKLTSATDSADVSIYGATEIPAEILDESRDPEAVRSVAIKRFL